MGILPSSQIYNFCAFWHKDELIRFWSQKVKGQGHRELHMV